MANNEFTDVEWINIPVRVKQLANEMGAPLERLGVSDGVNAGTDGSGTVIIGRPFLRQLEPREVRATLAHEFGHAVWPNTPMATHTLLIGIVVSLIKIAPLIRILVNVHPFVIFLLWKQISELATALLRPVQQALDWCAEFGSDLIASQHVGAWDLISALLKIHLLRDQPDAASATHPPTALRIALISSVHTP